MTTRCRIHSTLPIHRWDSNIVPIEKKNTRKNLGMHRLSQLK
jgi:hypothetical protein